MVFAAQNETGGRALIFIKPKVKVQISGTVERDGRNISVEKVEMVKSGENFDWSIDSTNGGSASARNYRVVGQIPAGTVFVQGTAKSRDAAQVTFSIDNGKSFSAEPMIDEKQPDGSTKKVAAPVSMFTQLKFLNGRKNSTFKCS